MKIQSLTLKDFRGIHDLTVNFDGRSTILFGINGVGKSSILAGINLLYANIIGKIVKQRFKQSIRLELSDIKVGKASATVAADILLRDREDIYTYWRRISHDGDRTHKRVQLENLTQKFTENYVGSVVVDDDNNLLYENKDFNMPIFVNYGVNRLVLKTPMRIKKGQAFDQFSALEKAIESQIDFAKLFEWFLEQEVYENSIQKEDSSYKDKALYAVKKSMLAMLDGYEDVHIVARPYSMKVKKGKDSLDILQLSDGEKCTLALFGDIARRLALANPSLDNPLEGTGIILIDEIELHMHTSWQRKVIAALKETFPNIQFIITTHSPQVLGEVDHSFKVFSMAKGTEDVVCEQQTSLPCIEE